MLNVTRLHPDAKTPTTAYGNPRDLGYDLYALEDTWVYKQPSIVRTGIAVAAYHPHINTPVPLGLIIKDRSSMAQKGVYTHAGVVDPGYRGEVKVVMTTVNTAPYFIVKGEKFAQMVPVMPLTGPVTIVDTLPVSDRDTGGFGSSDGPKTL